MLNEIARDAAKQMNWPLVVTEPYVLTPGNLNKEFAIICEYCQGRGKYHLRAHHGNDRIHLRIFKDDTEFALTDDNRHVFVCGTQFWDKKDTYSINVPELNITMTAPHGFDIEIEELTPVVNKLIQARSIIDSAKNGIASGTINDDDGLHVLITVVSHQYPLECTIFENPGNDTVTFAAFDRSNLGKINGNGYERDDFSASFKAFQETVHLWLYLRNLLGYAVPFVSTFDIGGDCTEWPGVIEYYVEE